jgi:hypothetical protein
MMLKHSHCVPTCAMPSTPATHSRRDTTRQQRASAVLRGSSKIFAKAHVLAVEPSSTKYGDRPSDERRRTMRWCCGRYDSKMAQRINLFFWEVGNGCEDEWVSELAFTAKKIILKIKVKRYCRYILLFQHRRLSRAPRIYRDMDVNFFLKNEIDRK